MPLEERVTEELAAQPHDRTDLELTTNLETQELIVSIKSPILKAFFERHAVERVNMPGVGQLFVVRTLPTIPGASFNNPEGPLLLETGEINMTALRAVALDRGVTIIERGLPLTEDFLRQVREAIQCVLRILYSEYLRPIKMGAVIEFKTT